LKQDLKELSQALGSFDAPVEVESAESCSRRAFVRATVALIEAELECLKCLLITLDGEARIKLDAETAKELLNEGENGRYLPTRKKIDLVCRALAQAFELSERQLGEQLSVAIEIRNRLTHPKSYNDLMVEVSDLRTVIRAEQSFEDYYVEFVAVAQVRRGKNW
jgi:hypothetical protein